MQYIIKNCPAYRAGMNLPHYCKAVGCCINTYVDGMDCITRKTVEEALAQIVNDIWQSFATRKQRVESIQGY